MKTKIISFIKKETVLCISAILAVISMFFVPPSAEYVSYIDFRTLVLLFCLMAVMSGFRKIGLFSALANSLLEKSRNFQMVSLILVLLCFFTSMLITNDVALITFVPFAIEVVRKSEKNKFMIPIIVLQTIAANLGSMLTPMGNPQNLYLYSLSGMSITDFILLVLPYTAISLVLLIIFNFSIKASYIEYNPSKTSFPAKSAVFYAVLFLICMLAVINIIDYKICFVITILAILIFNRKLITDVDYSLLMTFVFFFIFVGNMGNIEGFKNLILTLIKGREMIVSVAASQIISNVPAAVVLSSFTENVKELLQGVNIGGLGTPIASLASLITIKFYMRHKESKIGKFIIYFLASNILALILLTVFVYII